VTDLETRIETMETRIESLTAELEDPELYTKATGVTRAKELGIELERLKRDLERALEEWGTATDVLDTLAAEAT
jgi:hypothetical protein